MSTQSNTDMPSAWSATYTLSTPVPGTGHSQNESVRRASATQTLSVPDVLDRPRDKTRGAEVSHSALQFLFAEMVIYAQGRVSGISEFEQLLGSMGRQVGLRALAMQTQRAQSASNPKRPQRETRLLKTLLWVHSTLWKAVFGVQADNLERSTESDRSDECTYSISKWTECVSE